MIASNEFRKRESERDVEKVECELEANDFFLKRSGGGTWAMSNFWGVRDVKTFDVIHVTPQRRGLPFLLFFFSPLRTPTTCAREHIVILHHPYRPKAKGTERRPLTRKVTVLS